MRTAYSVRIMLNHAQFDKRGDVLWTISRTTAARRYYSLTVATKYYTHFVTARAKAQNAAAALRQRQCQRVEWSGRAAAPAGAHRRDAGAALAVGTKFRSGFGGHQDPALGQTALISPSGLPSLHRKSAFQTPGVKPSGFFFVSDLAR